MLVPQEQDHSAEDISDTLMGEFNSSVKERMGSCEPELQGDARVKTAELYSSSMSVRRLGDKKWVTI
jgi:hypothetical protein